MKLKKLVVSLLSAAMVVGSVAAPSSTASAASIESSLTCPGFFDARTKGVPISTKKTTITFTQTAKEATENYHCISYVVFSSDDGKFYAGGDANFAKVNEIEYFICRADIWGWTYRDGSEKNTGGDLPSGFKFQGKGPDNFEPKDSRWIGDLKKGIKSTITTQLNGKNVTVTYKAGKCTSTATIPVESSKNLYLGLTGEYCKATNIKASGGDTAAKLSLAKSSVSVAAGKSASVKATGATSATVDKAGKKNISVKVSKGTVKVTAKKKAKKGSYKVTVKGASGSATLTVTVK